MAHQRNLTTAKRWTFTEINALVRGFEARRVDKPFGVTDEGLADLRGVPLPDELALRGVQIERCDLSNARMRGVWIEGSAFDHVRFNGADLAAMADHGNTFTDCFFAGTRLEESAIGYRGSAYQRCCFDGAEFRRATFIRAEFDECQFLDCRLNGVDFNASSFVRCSFVGVLEDVWFRGGFALSSDTREFGQPRRNEMKHVSFENAELHDVTFSDQCDLSSIVVPSSGNYRLYDAWKSRLERVREASREWSLSERQEVDVFVNSSMPHAQNQQWELLNCDDVRSEHGQKLADRILDVLEGSWP